MRGETVANWRRPGGIARLAPGDRDPGAVAMNPCIPRCAHPGPTRGPVGRDPMAPSDAPRGYGTACRSEVLDHVDDPRPLAHWHSRRATASGRARSGSAGRALHDVASHPLRGHASPRPARRARACERGAGHAPRDCTNLAPRCRRPAAADGCLLGATMRSDCRLLVPTTLVRSCALAAVGGRRESVLA